MKTCVTCGNALSGRQMKHCSPLCASRAFNAARQADGRLKVQRQALRDKRLRWQRANDQRLGSRRSRYPAVSYKGDMKRQRLKQTATAEAFTSLEILDRDRWRCGLCGGRISKQRAYPDPLSASIDHVIPLSRGGDHTKANVQAAHLRCNISKHAGGGGEQLALLG